MKEKLSPYLAQHLEPKKKTLEDYSGNLDNALGGHKGAFPSVEEHFKGRVPTKEIFFEGEKTDTELRYSHIRSHVENHLYGARRQFPALESVYIQTHGHITWKTLDQFKVTSKSGKTLLDMGEFFSETQRVSDSTIEEWKKWNSYQEPDRFFDRKITVVFPALDSETIPDDSSRHSVCIRVNRGKEFSDQYLVIIPSDIITPRSILTLLHEIGHAVAREHTEEAINKADLRYRKYLSTFDKNILTEREKENPDFLVQVSEVILRSERDAWAFALNKIRPLVREGIITSDDIDYLVHHKALNSYSESIVKLLNPTLQQKIKRGIISWIHTKVGVAGERAE